MIEKTNPASQMKTPYETLHDLPRVSMSNRMYRPVVYICSPFAGDIARNTQAAKKYCRFAAERGYMPIAPHLLYPQFLNDNDPDERGLGMFFGCILMSKCEEVWVFGDMISAGMEYELQRAEWKGLRIRYFTEKLLEKKPLHGLKAIQTEYKGYRFRSRLEARWAVFFDACGVDWEYEPEGYDLGDGINYLPDFLLHGVAGRAGGDLYVEVKGKMSGRDAEKINRFVALGACGYCSDEHTKTPTLVVGNIPDGETADDIIRSIQDEAYSNPDSSWPYLFNFGTIDGDHFAAYPGINRYGKFELFGDDSNYLCDMDADATEHAYRVARQARFEFGETPQIGRT